VPNLLLDLLATMERNGLIILALVLASIGVITMEDLALNSQLMSCLDVEV